MLTKDNTGLVIVDIQGKLARLMHNSEQLIQNCAHLIQGAKILELPIIYLEQYPEKLGHTVDELRTHLHNIDPIEKYTFNACLTPDFLTAIDEAPVENWLICGIESHICVYQTVMSLHQRGTQVQVVTDCISSRTPENKQLALDKLAHQGVGLTGLEMCLYELIQDCRTPEFKAILPLIK